MLRGSRGDAAGVEPGASSIKRSSSEHGNRFVPVRIRTAGAVVRLGPPSTDRSGTGRSRRCDTRSHVVSEHTDGGSTMTKV